MSWYLPPYNMEVAIVVIVVFIVVLLLVIILVRLCTKYNCISCCDSDTDSVDDLEEELNDDDDDQDDAAANQSDCADDDVDVGEHHPQLTTTSADVGAGRMLDRDLEAGCYDDEEEVSQGVDYPGLAHDCPVFRGGKLQMEDDDGGDEFLINKMEESLL